MPGSVPVLPGVSICYIGGKEMKMTSKDYIKLETAFNIFGSGVKDYIQQSLSNEYHPEDLIQFLGDLYSNNWTFCRKFKSYWHRVISSIY